jgi:hypothetical protein
VWEITAKDHYLKGTRSVVLTEVEKCGALIRIRDLDNPSADAAQCPYMLARLFESDALRGAESGKQQQQRASRDRPC